MGNSYKKPIDRPFKIWCQSCQKWQPLNQKNKEWPPSDLTIWSHRPCAEGAMVYVFDDKAPTIPNFLSKEEPEWTPKCGNPLCDGTCDNLACIPEIRKPLVKVETKSDDLALLSDKKQCSKYWKYATILLCIIEVYLRLPVIHMAGH